MKTGLLNTGAYLRRLVRLPLLPFAFALECALLVACALCIGASVLIPAALRWGDAISALVMKTPDLNWYLPNTKDLRSEGTEDS